MINTKHGKIEHLRELLVLAVLVPWRSGSKGNRKKWRHIQLKPNE